MATFWLFLLVFTAIACGWLLGRFAGGQGPFPRGAAAAYGEYYRGLNFLLNDRPDEAIDAFAESLDVTKETFDTHLALGNLMRRKGEVERALRIHQNLLARPSLPPAQLQQAHLELARDFISAGLYDRAERLLQDLVQQSEELRSVSLRHLVEIYQAERDWAKAIETASRLLPRRNLFLSAPDPDPQMEGAIAHFHCELAQRTLDKNDDFQGGRAHLKQALMRDEGCVRASLLQGLLEYRAGHFQEAIDALRRVREQDAALLPEALDTLRACYDAAGRRQQLRIYLSECQQEQPSTRVVLAICEEITHQEGAEAAAEFLAEQMRKRPTLRGLLALLSMHRDRAGDSARENLDVLQLLLQGLIASKPAYQCHHCGFSGRQLHWLCPSCKQWNTVQPIRGAEGD